MSKHEEMTAEQAREYERKALARDYIKREMRARSVSAQDIANYLDVHITTIQRRIDDAVLLSVILECVREIEYIKTWAHNPEQLKAFAGRLLMAANKADGAANNAE